MGDRHCNDFKDASKARCPSSTHSAGVAIPNAKALTEYDAGARELVPSPLSGSRLLERAPGYAEDCGEARGTMHAVPHAQISLAPPLPLGT
jgi:hypothetical protein